MPHPDDERRSFLTPIFFATAIAGWMAVPAFIWTKDILLVGPGARSFSATEVLLTLQSMVVWGIFTPFIFEASQRLEFEPGKRLRAVGWHLLFALFLSVLDVSLSLFFSLFTHLEEVSFEPKLNQSVFINTFSYLLLAGIGYALVYQRRLAASRVGALELQRQLVQTRLDVLARTLQPHFLFNTLNTVAALVRLNENKRALNAVVALSDLLRVVLKTGGDARVPLHEELRFVEHYVAIERLRFEDRLVVENSIEPAAADLLVPALILQPLIENAIRHGVEVSGQGRVRIEAQGDGQSLTVRVKVNSLVEAGDTRVAGLGIGLDVTRRRLAYIYGDERFALDLFVGCGQSAVTLRIPREETVYVGTDHHPHRG
ncbi:MAG TPA: histidine kinase [Steroidobacteraceae bacterium]|jgi:hypothetical protein|nr:histidine kinase [Steroidobacteraceae bacterium]